MSGGSLTVWEVAAGVVLFDQRRPPKTIPGQGRRDMSPMGQSHKADSGVSSFYLKIQERARGGTRNCTLMRVNLFYGPTIIHPNKMLFRRLL